MSDCVEQVGDSVDEIQRSLKEMEQPGGGGLNFASLMNDVETWVSAALTDDDTCMDAFAGLATDGKVHRIVRRRILHVAQMTSNALALINIYASTKTALS